MMAKAILTILEDKLPLVIAIIRMGLLNKDHIEEWVYFKNRISLHELYSTCDTLDKWCYEQEKYLEQLKKE
jgi:hypothetical protein